MLFQNSLCVAVGCVWCHCLAKKKSSILICSSVDFLCFTAFMSSQACCREASPQYDVAIVMRHSGVSAFVMMCCLMPKSLFLVFRNFVQLVLVDYRFCHMPSGNFYLSFFKRGFDYHPWSFDQSFISAIEAFNSFRGRVLPHSCPSWCLSPLTFWHLQSCLECSFVSWMC